MNNNEVQDVSSRELVNSRVMKAPQELVYKAWTTSELLMQWWGPKGFANTFEEFDPRPGGNWIFTMHGPDGTDYPNRSVYVELVEPERIVFDHLTGPRFQVTATMEDLDGKNTRLTFRMLFDTAEEYNTVKPYAFKGNEQNFDRLESLLAS
jgi:uncharacterized protein YndB with AHSA1/START domain